MIGYLNINSLRNKISDVREILFNASIDILCIDETKLDCSFPESQFCIDGYNFPPFRRDRNNYGGGKIVYIKEGIISKRLNQLEGTNMESICIELTISNIRWCVLFIYRPPSKNKNNFFA